MTGASRPPINDHSSAATVRSESSVIRPKKMPSGEHSLPADLSILADRMCGQPGAACD